jgi:hypothetical protein
MENSLDTINKIKTYKFVWNEYIANPDLVNKPDVGVVAQDIATVWDYAIASPSKNRPLSGSEPYMKVNYTKFVPLLINALQELSSQVLQLSSKTVKD